MAVTLWFLVTLNKQSYIHAVKYPYTIENVPPNVQLLTPSPGYVFVRCQGSGIELLNELLNLNRDTIRINFPKHSGSKRFITREIAHHVANTYLYQNQKSIDTFGFQYTPITQTIQETGQQFLTSIQQNKSAMILPLI